ncbi:MAG: hypothetical protein K1T65_04115 [Candidatus Aramenus sp.]|nr:hypothetical protein [Candidatus Aramenus sp.]
MNKFYTVMRTDKCHTNYGLFECSIEDGKEKCSLIACVLDRESSLSSPLEFKLF